jgi:hypothetical protein
LQISIVEMFLPMQVREPWPNCIALQCEYLRAERWMRDGEGRVPTVLSRAVI